MVSEGSGDGQVGVCCQPIAANVAEKNQKSNRAVAQAVFAIDRFDRAVRRVSASSGSFIFVGAEFLFFGVTKVSQGYACRRRVA
jgi:hypothetical protein